MDSLRVPVKSLVAVRGQEDNHIMGVGLVTGLAGTGDTSDTAKQLVMNLLLTRNINIDIQDLNAKNVAIVRVESDLPAGLKPGRSYFYRFFALGRQSPVGRTRTAPAVALLVAPPRNCTLSPARAACRRDKLARLHQFDCLRANKSTMAWGVEARVPFLDADFLECAMI